MAKLHSVHGVMLLMALGVGGCSLDRAAPSATFAAAKGGGEPAVTSTPADGAKSGADAAKTAMPKTSRKVIRNAELAIEVASPAGAESKVSSLVEKLGGYVA